MTSSQSTTRRPGGMSVVGNRGLRPDQGFGTGGGQFRQGHVHTLRPGGPGRDLIGLEFDAQALRRQGQIGEIAQVRGHAVPSAGRNSDR